MFFETPNYCRTWILSISAPREFVNADTLTQITSGKASKIIGWRIPY
jgi:hypothetical protein